MNKTTFRFFAQFFVVLAPLCLGSWSIFDSLGLYSAPDKNGNISMTVHGLSMLSGSRDHVEFKLRVATSIAIFIVAVFAEWRNSVVPLQRLLKFREAFLQSRYDKTWRGLLGDGFRFNVMLMRHPLRYGFLPVFDWVWSCNFRPELHHHRDAGLFLTKWQGVCGKVFREERPQAVFFDGTTSRWELFKLYRMFPGQQKKTSGIRAIFSVPIFRASESAAEPAVCIGVLNIDAMTPEAAKVLQDNYLTLSTFFAEDLLAVGQLSL